MKHIWPFSRSISRSSVAQIIPARGITLQERRALEGTMQSLVLQGSALALEIASTPADTQQAQSVQFLLRAHSEEALRAATRQIQVRYPQAIVRHVPPEEDPFHVQANETVSAMELRAGGEAYETLRSWSPGKPHEQGIDPLLGVLLSCFTPCGSKPAAGDSRRVTLSTSGGVRRYAETGVLQKYLKVSRWGGWLPQYEQASIK